MHQVDTTRRLKRQASGDIEELPIKQARTSVLNAQIRRFPPLRRSDSQALDINAATAIVEHLPDAHEPVPVPSQHFSRGEEDQAGSTDEESQDEEAVWDRRAKAHRHHMLFKRPREPAPKIRRPKTGVLIKTASEVTLMESDSENEQPLEPVNRFTMGEAAKTAQRLRAHRAPCPAQPKQSTVAPSPIVGSALVPSVNLATTIRRVTCTTSTTTTSATKPVHLQKTSSITGPARPQRQNSRVRQTAIGMITRHHPTAIPSSSVAPPVMSKILPSSLMPSQILRRSRRIAAKQQQPL